MRALLIAAADLAAQLSPARIETIGDRIRGSIPTEMDEGIHRRVITPAARATLDRLLAVWDATGVSGDLLAGILVGAAYARQQTQREGSVELVWTGPTTPFVATH